MVTIELPEKFQSFSGCQNDIIIDPTSDQKLHVIEWHHLNLYKFCPGLAIGSLCLRGIVYPMDLVRSRLQLQEQSKVYRGMFHAFTEIVRTERLSGLYRGFWVISPQIFAMFAYNTIYENVRDLLHRKVGISSTPLVSAFAGGTASVFEETASVPMDIIAQYMMIYHRAEHFTKNGKKQNVIDFVRNDGLDKKWLSHRIFRAIYKLDGIRGFFRGLCASMLVYVPYCSFFWFTYYKSMSSLKDLMNWWKFNQPGRLTDGEDKHFICLQAISGGIAGMSSAVLTNPFEMFRIRIQVHRTGYLETLKHMWTIEKSRMFYKGLSPRICSMGIYSFLYIFMYEAVKKLSIRPEYRYLAVW